MHCPRSTAAAQIIEVAPGLDIEGITDVALKHADVQAGVLVVERQFGYLEFHGETGAVKAAADAASAETRRLVGVGHPARRSLPRDHLEHRPPARVPDQSQQDRLDGAGRRVRCTCWRSQPASYAILATNEAEKAADIKVVDFRMIGATGRVYLSGAGGRRAAGGGAAAGALEG